MFDSDVSRFDRQNSSRDQEAPALARADLNRAAAVVRNNGYPLAMARDNEQLTITSMHGGRRYRRQLMDMGLRPGLNITVMRGGGNGPVLLQVGDTRLGIGRGMAEKIEVVPAKTKPVTARAKPVSGKTKPVTKPASGSGRDL